MLFVCSRRKPQPMNKKCRSTQQKERGERDDEQRSNDDPVVSRNTTRLQVKVGPVIRGEIDGYPGRPNELPAIDFLRRIREWGFRGEKHHLTLARVDDRFAVGRLSDH